MRRQVSHKSHKLRWALGSFFLGGMAAFFPSYAEEEVARSVSVTGAQALKIAEALIQKGELSKAAAILQNLTRASEDTVDKTQVYFLLGMIEAANENFEPAEEIFRNILDERPELIRVRLELARTLYEQKKDIAATYHFQYVLGNGLPEDTKRIVRTYLTKIEHRKKFRTSISAGIIPNTNINAGPKDDIITVFGLPFQLDDDAQRQSGVGLSSSLSVAAFPKISKNLRLEARAAARVVDYSNADFDDVFVSTEVGPRFLSKKINASVLGTLSKRYFGGDAYSTSYGTRFVVSTPLSKRMRFSVRGSLSEVSYEDNPTRDGPVYAAGISILRILDKKTRGAIGLQVTREQAEANQLKNTQYRLNTSLTREWGWGLTTQVLPDIFLREFENSGREDITYAATLRLTKRDWRYYGFAPVFSYTYLKNNSNSPFFDYERHSADIGLTRSF